MVMTKANGIAVMMMLLFLVTGMFTMSGPAMLTKRRATKRTVISLQTMGRRKLRNLERQQMWSPPRTPPAQR